MQAAKLGITGDHLDGKLDKTIEAVRAFDPTILTGDITVPASGITAERVSWMWPGYLARREMAMFDGLPGEGKSQLLIDLAARGSQGWPMPPDPVGWPDHRPTMGLTSANSDID